MGQTEGSITYTTAEMGQTRWVWGHTQQTALLSGTATISASYSNSPFSVMHMWCFCLFHSFGGKRLSEIIFGGKQQTWTSAFQMATIFWREISVNSFYCLLSNSRKQSSRKYLTEKWRKQIHKNSWYRIRQMKRCKCMWFIFQGKTLLFDIWYN